MSNVKRMDIWTVVRTILEENPGLRAKYLIPELESKTGLSHSTIYEHLGSFEHKGKIHREKGRYWLEKPEKEQTERKSSFWNYFKHRSETKLQEKKERKKEQEAQTYAEVEWLAENWPMYKGLKDYFEIRRKIRKEYGLDE